MDLNRLKPVVYAQSWVENYLTSLVHDQPHHKELLKSFLIVSEGLNTLRTENSELERRLNSVRDALR